MRFNFRVKIAQFTFFAMIAKTQTIEGVTSLQKDGKHIVMWDLENCTLKQAQESLKFVQKKYCLADIFVVSDCENSFRGWCYSHVDFNTYMKILVDTQYLDPNFLQYTLRRGKATLRTGNKQGRPPQKLVSVLLSYPVPIHYDDCTVERVVYDAGLVKKGLFYRSGRR